MCGFRSPRLRQRRLAPLPAGPLDAARCQVELVGAQLLDAEGVHEPVGVGAEGGAQRGDRGHPGEAAPGLGVHLAHEQRAVRPREQVESYPPPLGQELPDLDVVALAGALLLALPGVAVVEQRLPRQLAEGRRGW